MSKFTVRLVKSLVDMRAYVYETFFDDWHDDQSHFGPDQKRHYDRRCEEHANTCEHCSLVLTIKVLNMLGSGRNVGNYTLQHLRRWIVPEEYKRLKALYKGRFS